MDTLAIANPFNAPIYHVETAATTMAISRELAAQGKPHGTVIVADLQEAGRGRIAGRSWAMAKGDLAFTLLLRYPGVEVIPQAFTLRTGLAVALAIEDFIPELRGTVWIKWPNDIMIGSSSAAKKAAGILCEFDGENIFAGIGVNVTQKNFSGDLSDKATSLSLAVGKDIDYTQRDTLLEKILVRLHSELKSADTDWHARLEERLYKKGETVSFIEGAADSGNVSRGRLLGINPGGELLIAVDGEMQAKAFTTGELVFGVCTQI